MNKLFISMFAITSLVGAMLHGWFRDRQEPDKPIPAWITLWLWFAFALLVASNFWKDGQ